MIPEQKSKFNPDFFLTYIGFIKNTACNKEAANNK